MIRVGVPDEYVDRLMPGLLTHLGRRDPDLAVEVQCASSAVLERRVRGDRLDMTSALAEEIDGGGELVATDPLVWLQAPQTPLSRRRPLPVALFDHTCSWRNRAMAASTAGAGLVPIRGADAPPALTPAELILLGGICRDTDIDLLVGKVRELVSTGRAD